MSIQRMTWKDRPRPFYVVERIGQHHQLKMSEIYTDDYNCLNSADGHLTGIEYTTIKVWSSIGARSLEDLLYVVPIEDDRDQGCSQRKIP